MVERTININLEGKKKFNGNLVWFNLLELANYSFTEKQKTKHMSETWHL